MSGGKIEIIEKALNSLGKGFDITSDFRLKYCKGDRRLVILNESETRDLHLPGFGTVHNVSVDIKSDKADRTRYQSDILDFKQMSELFNKECSVAGKIPSGLFNAMFGFQSGSWAEDASNIKWLGLDGYYIGLFSFRIDPYPLALSHHVRNAVPSSWDPLAIAKFIEKYGTHIVVGLAMGGQDVVLVRQDRSSSIEAWELKRHLQDLGDQLFSGTCNFSPARTPKERPPQAFTSLFDPHPSLPFTATTTATKNGITIICSKRGGDPSISSHCEWISTVPATPDAIHLNFIPITSLLGGVAGKGFLSHAINLYMRYKPPISDLEYFLDFQGHKMWAPVHNDHPLGPATNQTAYATTYLQLNLLGPKLYVNSIQVQVGKRPVVGMRLYLEGRRRNRLAVHLQHLSNTPVLFQGKIEESSAGIWKGSDEISDDRFFEPIQWKRFSHVCTAPVELDSVDVHSDQCPTAAAAAAFIVTGVQLLVNKYGNKSVLHLRLHYSKVSDFVVVQSNWLQNRYNSSESSLKSGFLSAVLSKPMSGLSSATTASSGKGKKTVVMDSSVFPDGPPVPTETTKLVKFVDLSELCRGPENGPGYWLVTGAKLDMEKGKICLMVKFSLLNVSSSSSSSSS